MGKRLLSRRQTLIGGGRIAAGAALFQFTGGIAHAGQLPAPEPLHDNSLVFVVTTESQPWQTGKTFKSTFSWQLLNLNVHPTRSAPTGGRNLPMQGFGGCFNELGWTSLSALSETNRESVMHELFDPKAGARFSYCRMPIGANDFATGPYTYDETPGDFSLSHFSIDHDKKTLIPFIQAALRHRPDLHIWASPWTPPSWMKKNHFYAEAMPRRGMTPTGIRPDQVGHEGENLFIEEPRYFEAYARYFGRFIDAYRAEGIRVGMVMPQNEFNSAQSFPSCTWTPEGLARFVEHLGPEMRNRGVEIFFGTLERGNPALFNTFMADGQAAQYIRGLGMQWAGKNAVPALHRQYPGLPIFQTEQECGDGSNSWSYTGYCWQLMKHYFRSGACGYMYWNISLDRNARSTWGWRQNSLVSVDNASKTYHFNHDYYLLKHLTHFVDVGAFLIDVTGTCDDVLAFRNPDGTAVLLIRNELPHPQLVQVQLPERSVAVQLPPDSIGTLSVKST